MQDALVDKLCADGMITSAVVERAFRTVPRHRFMPAGTPLQDAYAADVAVKVKTDERGTLISSVSAPFIQARMIEQARLGPGMSVLEIGSGGCNAALLAEVVGPEGRVVSVDIDPEVTRRADTLLKETGYGHRVRVVPADAEYGVPGEPDPFDAIIVTVGAWDIPPAWPEQLAPHGRLVVPLRMNGVTRSIAFVRQGDHLVSTSAEVCGFVPMQGAGAHPERGLPLLDAEGRTVELRFDTGAPEDRICCTECSRPRAPKCGPASRSSTWSPSPACTCGSRASCPGSAGSPRRRESSCTANVKSGSPSGACAVTPSPTWWYAPPWVGTGRSSARGPTESTATGLRPRWSNRSKPGIAKPATGRIPRSPSGRPAATSPGCPTARSSS